MKTLILMRHAKSSWASPGLGDHDRPLNKRGEAAAPVMARWLADRGLVPDRVLCSSALRTRQTAEHMRTAVPEMPEPVAAPGLYHASPGAILAAVRQSPPEAGVVLVVVHEPGISAAASRLSDGTGPAEFLDALGHFPTAAVAVLEAPVGDWADFGWGAARVTAFAKPKELIESVRAAGERRPQ
jgi:phosphohistidine phosphatase